MPTRSQTVVFTMGFAALLKFRRVTAGLTQEQLAARADLSARSVRDIERGRVRHPRPETARLLGVALGLSGCELDEFVSRARRDYWAGRSGGNGHLPDVPPSASADEPPAGPGEASAVGNTPAAGEASGGRPARSSEIPKPTQPRDPPAGPPRPTVEPYENPPGSRDNAVEARRNRDGPHHSTGPADHQAGPRHRPAVSHDDRSGSYHHPAGSPVEPWAVPQFQLPVDVPEFVGRRQQLRELDGLLDGGGLAARICVVFGTAGVGKTALAVHWARTVAERFPDGQLYVNLHGLNHGGVRITPAEALSGFLSALGIPAARIPADTRARTGLFRGALAGRRMLIVLDNADDAGQVRPLLPDAPGCLTLVTSRLLLTSLIALEGAQPLQLGLPDRAEQWQLLASRLGAFRLAAEPAATGEIVDRCAGLPLALTVVAARAAARPGLPLASLAAKLRGERDLDAFAAADPAIDIRSVFSPSYLALPPAAARLFRLLGLHPGADITESAAASLAGIPPAEAGRLLDELCRAHLVTEHVSGHYAPPGLLTAYAVELCRSVDRASVRQAATRRILDHYLYAA